MKILICTQKVDKNDDLLGFFHAWITEFSRQCDFVTVVCLFQGETDMPGNVRVLSLGKEHVARNMKHGAYNTQHETCNMGGNRNLLHVACCMLRYTYHMLQKTFLRIKYFSNFYKYIWQERKNYDAVFVHMNPIYVLLGGLFWKIWHKKIGLWFAHGHVPWELRVAEKIVDNIFTSTASGCRLDSSKIKIVGQGIDVDRFMQHATRNMQHVSHITQHATRNKQQASFVIPAKAGIQGNSGRIVKLITIGRISPVKDLETLILAVDVLVKKGIDVSLDIIGAIGLAEQKEYYDSLLALTKEKKLEARITFVGSVPNPKIIGYLQKSDIFVSASQTGSLDKTFLEAMACGLPIIGCNVALDAVLGEYRDRLLYSAGDYLELSRKIEGVIGLSDDEYLRMSKRMREIVEREHGLLGFVGKIIGFYKISKL